MTLSSERLQALFDHPNVKAFYAVVRRGESSLGPEAYTMVNGGPPITDFSKHPYAGLSTKQGGRAAGAPQFIPSTWQEIAERYSLPDFSPASQDLGFVGCVLKRTGAIDALLAGRFEEAVRICRPEWTSLPGASENNPAWNMDKARALYIDRGGRLDNEELLQPAAPIEERSQPPDKPEQPETFMPIPAIILGLIQAAASVLPVIAQIKGDKTQSSATQNVNIASKVLDVVATTVGAVNQQQAVEIVQQDPAARQKADEALRAQFFDLMKFAQEQETAAWERTEKSVSDARSFAEKMLGKEGWQSIGFGALIGLLAVIIIVGAGWMLWQIAENVSTDATTRGLIVGAAIAMLGQVVSYFFGSSSSSQAVRRGAAQHRTGKGAAMKFIVYQG
jgi:muramidase (phage lysozyme)/ElaB/YqjD/DUF883 family membrane-anchored ribosome-binding protein